jgi:transcriptional regulator with XRE-family HTH domain
MNIKDIKEKLKPFKQGYVASQLNMTEGYLSQVLNGKQPLSKKTEKMLNDFLNKHNQ